MVMVVAVVRTVTAGVYGEISGFTGCNGGGGDCILMKILASYCLGVLMT